MPNVSRPWVDDIDMKLLYDFGPHMTLVDEVRAALRYRVDTFPNAAELAELRSK